MNRIKDKEMFLQDAEIVAPYLLGKILARKTDAGEIIKGRISEVEIYKQDETACHAYRGKTKRNAPLFEEGGTVYVYLCYGIYNLINIVCGKSGFAQGLMIRGVNDIYGSGRVGMYFKMDRALSGESIFLSKNIWLEDDGYRVSPENIQKFKRVGIDYASQIDRDRLWRYRITV